MSGSEESWTRAYGARPLAPGEGCAEPGTLVRPAAVGLQWLLREEPLGSGVEGGTVVEAP